MKISNYLVFSFLLGRLCGIPPSLAIKVVKDLKETTGSHQKEDEKLPYAGTTGDVQKKGAKRFKKDDKISFQKINICVGLTGRG